MPKLRGLIVGCGYFAGFHREAWAKMPEVEIVGVCDKDQSKAKAAAAEFPTAIAYSDPAVSLDARRPDFIDIVTPPDTHFELVQLAAEHRTAIICQKALAPTYAEARRIVAVAAEAGVPFMVHENFRFQPWYREIKRLLDTGAIGDRLHSVGFRCRTGDGWGSDAYLDRQPYFRTMSRLLVFESGVHFIDTFRFLAGEVRRVHAVLRQLNPVIAGEDCGLIVFEFASGAVGLWDANRYNEPNYPDPRYTFGECLIEAEGGSVRLYPDGRVTVQQLGRHEREVEYPHTRVGFAGDCVYHTQRHFIEKLREGQAFETSGPSYLRTLAVQEAVYESARTGQPVEVPNGE